MLPTLLKEHERRLRRKSTIAYKRQRKRKKIVWTCLGIIIFVLISIWMYGWKYFFLSITTDSNIQTEILNHDEFSENGNDNIGNTAKKRNKDTKKNKNQLYHKNANENQVPLNSCDEITYYIEQNDLTDSDTLIVAGGKLLRPGILYENERVKYGEYSYFQACLPKYNTHHHFHNIEIKIKATNGDPDLYISPIKPKPTKTTSTWISKGIGGESITLPSNLKEFPRGTQTLYIGVHGGGNKFDYKEFLAKKKTRMQITNSGDNLYATFSIIVNIKDRKNPYKYLRVRKDDKVFKDEVERETWRPTHDEE